MKTPKTITDAAKRYLGYLDNEIRETQFARDNAQRDLEHFMARVTELDGRIKQIRADQEEIKEWLAAQEKEEQE